MSEPNHFTSTFHAVFSDVPLARTWSCSSASSTLSGTSVTETSYGSSSSTIKGPGALSGRAIKALGILTLRGIERVILERRLADASRFFSRRPISDATRAEELYDDILELSRIHLYPRRIQRRANEIVIREILQSDISILLKCIAKWPFVELRLFLFAFFSARLPARVRETISVFDYLHSYSAADKAWHRLYVFVDALSSRSEPVCALLADLGLDKLKVKYFTVYGRPSEGSNFTEFCSQILELSGGSICDEDVSQLAMSTIIAQIRQDYETSTWTRILLELSEFHAGIFVNRLMQNKWKSGGYPYETTEHRLIYGPVDEETLCTLLFLVNLSHNSKTFKRLLSQYDIQEMQLIAMESSVRSNNKASSEKWDSIKCHLILKYLRLSHKNARRARRALRLLLEELRAHVAPMFVRARRASPFIDEVSTWPPAHTWQLLSAIFTVKLPDDDTLHVAPLLLGQIREREPDDVQLYLFICTVAKASVPYLPLARKALLMDALFQEAICIGYSSPQPSPDIIRAFTSGFTAEEVHCMSPYGEYDLECVKNHPLLMLWPWRTTFSWVPWAYRERRELGSAPLWPRQAAWRSVRAADVFRRLGALQNRQKLDLTLPLDSYHDVCVDLLEFLGCRHDVEDLSDAVSYWYDTDARVRAAAADALVYHAVSNERFRRVYQECYYRLAQHAELGNAYHFLPVDQVHSMVATACPSGCFDTCLTCNGAICSPWCPTNVRTQFDMF